MIDAKEETNDYKKNLQFLYETITKTLGCCTVHVFRTNSYQWYWTFLPCSTQDYEVADIDCNMEPGKLTARLRRPEGFRGAPLFADQREVNPLVHPLCQIHQDSSDTSGRIYALHVTDFGKCGVIKKNGFVNVRIWFPQLPGVVMVADQEVIIMCRPPQSTITETRSAGFASSMPSGARVSGIVEESPGHLEYEVALFREAATRATDDTELPLDQAVPIGTKLQLRARINSKSAWKYAKLVEVTVSPDPEDAHAPGHVNLVKSGCRNGDLNTIIPHQPARYRDRPYEVYLDFEAFLLSGLGERSTLWIHSQIKACMENHDCMPEFCLDVYQPSGHGRKRKRSYVYENENQTPETEFIHSDLGRWTDIIGPGMATSKPLINRQAGRRASSSHTVALPSSTMFSNSVPPTSSTTTPISTTTKTSPTTTAPIIYSTPKVLKQTQQKKDANITSTKFGDNIGYTVIMPQDYFSQQMESESCAWLTALSAALAAGALLLGLLAGGLAMRLRQNSSFQNKIAEPPKHLVNPLATSSRASSSHQRPTSNSRPISSRRYERDLSVLRP